MYLCNAGLKVKKERKRDTERKKGRHREKGRKEERDVQLKRLQCFSRQRSVITCTIKTDSLRLQQRKRADSS